MQSTDRPVRLAFIGAGSIAELQMRTFARMPGVELAGVADINARASAKFATQFGCTAHFGDFHAMLEAVRPDAVSVCTSNRAHAECTIAALESGADVLCEKPLASTVAEGREMVATAEATGRKLVIGFQYRFNPRTTFLRAAVNDGQLGRILYGRVQALRRRGIPNWGVFGQKALQGGGPLIDIGVHVLEMAHYTMGSPRPVSASADMFTYLGNKPSDAVECEWKGWDHTTYDVEDLAVGRIRFENGAVIHIESSFAAHIEQDQFNFQLMGDTGGCTWNPAVIFRDSAGHMVNSTPGWLSAKQSWQDNFDAKLYQFIAHVRGEADTIAPAKDGLAVQCMLDALYRSAEAGGSEVAIA